MRAEREGLLAGPGPWGPLELARRVAADIRPGSCVNLGIGMPTAVADFVDPRADVVLHSENGILGVGPRPPEGDEDPDLVNAGKQPVTLVPGASILSHCDSFALIRGGHLDLAVMGALQVSVHGDLANWTADEPGSIPAVGGAMDLAAGASAVWAVMRLFDGRGVCKLVPTCTLPLTAAGVTSRVYTDYGVFSTGPAGVTALAVPAGVTAELLRARTGLPL